MRCRCDESIKELTDREWKVVGYMEHPAPASDPNQHPFSRIRCLVCGREWLTRGAYMETLRASAVIKMQAARLAERARHAAREHARRKAARLKPKRLHMEQPDS